MPIYEFDCRDCSCRFEELLSQSTLEEGAVSCPDCGSNSVERLISSFCFKSSGGNGAASMGNSCGPCSKTSCSGCGSS